MLKKKLKSTLCRIIDREISKSNIYCSFRVEGPFIKSIILDCHTHCSFFLFFFISPIIISQGIHPAPVAYYTCFHLHDPRNNLIIIPIFFISLAFFSSILTLFTVPPFFVFLSLGNFLFQFSNLIQFAIMP